MEEEIDQEKKKASKLRILFRLAFICNMFFIVYIILRYVPLTYIPQPLIQLSVLLGWFAPVMNFINFVLALIFLSRLRKGFVPYWLLYTNVICFLIQIFFFFILKDVQHT